MELNRIIKNFANVGTVLCIIVKKMANKPFEYYFIVKFKKYFGFFCAVILFIFELLKVWEMD